MLSEDIFLKGMAVLGAAYPDYDLKQSTMDIYRTRLCPRFTPPEWEAAINPHIDTCKWFPKISELLQAVRITEISAEEVWGILIVAARDGKLPELSEAGTVALSAIDGWESF